MAISQERQPGLKFQQREPFIPLQPRENGPLNQQNYQAPLSKEERTDLLETQNRQAKKHGFPSTGSIYFRNVFRSFKDFANPLKWFHALRKAL